MTKDKANVLSWSSVHRNPQAVVLIDWSTVAGLWSGITDNAQSVRLRAAWSGTAWVRVRIRLGTIVAALRKQFLAA